MPYLIRVSALVRVGARVGVVVRVRERVGDEDKGWY